MVVQTRQKKAVATLLSGGQSPTVFPTNAVLRPNTFPQFNPLTPGALCLSAASAAKQLCGPRAAGHVHMMLRSYKRRISLLMLVRETLSKQTNDTELWKWSIHVLKIFFTSSITK